VNWKRVCERKGFGGLELVGLQYRFATKMVVQATPQPWMYMGITYFS